MSLVPNIWGSLKAGLVTSTRNVPATLSGSNVSLENTTKTLNDRGLRRPESPVSCRHKRLPARFQTKIYVKVSTTVNKYKKKNDNAQVTRY